MPDVDAEKFRFNWQTPILLSSFNPDIVYMGTQILHRSMDKAESFSHISSDLTRGPKAGNVPYGTIVTLSESPLRFGVLYAGTDDGNIQLSLDGGYTWTLVSSNLPKNLYVSRVTASAFSEGRVYATLNGYRDDNFTAWLFLSDDFGKTWTQLGKDLPSESLNVVKEDPVYEDILYVGSDNGLYATLNRGKNFMALGKLPSVPVHDIAIQKTANEIVIGTHGRSIYIASLDTVHKAFKARKK